MQDVKGNLTPKRKTSNIVNFSHSTQKCIVKQNTISLKQMPISERIPMTVLTEYKRETKNCQLSLHWLKWTKNQINSWLKKKNSITAFYAHYVSQAISSCMNMFPLFLNSSEIYHSVNTRESTFYVTSLGIIKAVCLLTLCTL